MKILSFVDEKDLSVFSQNMFKVTNSSSPLNLLELMKFIIIGKAYRENILHQYLHICNMPL